MAIQHDEHQERLSLEEFFALLENDPEHRYELIDSYPCMMTGGHPLIAEMYSITRNRALITRQICAGQTVCPFLTI
ncbi:MAG TPA: hypothetical protein VGD98_06615 [Ktedonobacteraceae bacterium]